MVAPSSPHEPSFRSHVGSMIHVSAMIRMIPLSALYIPLLVCSVAIRLAGVQSRVGCENIVEMIDEMDPGGREYITQVMSPTAVPLPLSTGAGDDSFLDGFAEGSLPPSVFEGSFDVAGGSIEAQYAFGMPGGTPARVPPGEDGEGDEDDD